MNEGAEKIVREFEEYLLSEGKGEKTIASYTGDVSSFISWLEENKVTFKGQISRAWVTGYRGDLLDDNYTVNTVNKKINSLHSFNHFLINKRYTIDLSVIPHKDKVKIANGSQLEAEIFTEDEVRRMLFHIEDKEKVSLRDRAAVLLLLYTGVRVGELVSIRIRDIDFLTLNLKVIGKGGKAREIPLKGEVVDAVKEYMENERKESRFSSSDYLLLTQRAGRMDEDTVNKLLRKLGASLGMMMKPHKFRHTFCTRLLKKGVELTTVAKLAGHSGVNTTANFYINTSKQDKKNAVDLL